MSDSEWAQIQTLTAENASLRAVIAEAQEIVQAALSAQQGGVTEAMVEVACEAFFDGDGYQWDESSGADHVRASMRAALTAALSAHQGEG